MPPQASPPIPKRPQTSRAARRAYNKRGGPTISEAERKRIERGAVLEERAATIRDKERKKKENKRKREEKEAKQKEERRLMGIEEVVKIEEGQMRLSRFLKKPPQSLAMETSQDDGDAGAHTVVDHPRIEDVTEVPTENKTTPPTLEAMPKPFTEIEEQQLAARRGSRKASLELQASPTQAPSSTLTLTGDVTTDEVDEFNKDAKRAISASLSRCVRLPLSSKSHNAQCSIGSKENMIRGAKRKGPEDDMEAPPQKRKIAAIDSSLQRLPRQSPVKISSLKAKWQPKTFEGKHGQNPRDIMPPPPKIRMWSPSPDDTWANFFQSSTQIAREIASPAEKAEKDLKHVAIRGELNFTTEATQTSKNHPPDDSLTTSANKRLSRLTPKTAFATNRSSNPMCKEDSGLRDPSSHQVEAAIIGSDPTQKSRPLASADRMAKLPASIPKTTPFNPSRTYTIDPSATGSDVAGDSCSRPYVLASKPMLRPNDKQALDELLGGISTQELDSWDKSNTQSHALPTKTSLATTSSAHMDGSRQFKSTQTTRPHTDSTALSSNSALAPELDVQDRTIQRSTSTNPTQKHFKNNLPTNNATDERIGGRKEEWDSHARLGTHSTLATSPADTLDGLDWSLSSQELAILDEAANSISTRAGTETPTPHLDNHQASAHTADPPILSDPFELLLGGISSQELVALVV